MKKRMSTLSVLVTVAVCTIAALSNVTLVQPVNAQSADTAKPINDMCPIGKEPLQSKVDTVTYDGHVIGFCCPGCDKAFLKWDEHRKDEFVRLALQDKEPGQEVHGNAQRDSEQRDSSTTKPAATQPSAFERDPYTLDTCPVSGQELGSMGDPVVKVYGNREVRFCCASCIEPFEKNQEKHFKQIDAKMIERQLPYYPLDTCIISGQKLGSMGDPVNRIYGNRLVRFCCAGCIDAFEKDMAGHFRTIDEAVVEQQRDEYPLDICVVSGMKLGSMGEPTEMIIGTRLVRFCCASCHSSMKKEPAMYLKRLDDAWKAKRAAESR